MKVTVELIMFKTVEVDDEFNALCSDHPDYIGFPANENQYDKLFNELEMKTKGIDPRKSKHIQDDLLYIADIYRDEDDYLIAQW